MKGYKAFNKCLKCKGYQFKENEIFELIKDTKCKYCLRYAEYSNNDWEDFK